MGGELPDILPGATPEGALACARVMLNSGELESHVLACIISPAMRRGWFRGQRKLAERVLAALVCKLDEAESMAAVLKDCVGGVPDSKIVATAKALALRAKILGKAIASCRAALDAEPPAP